MTSSTRTERGSRSSQPSRRAARDLVTVWITQPLAGIAQLDNISSVRKERIGELAGLAGADAMEAVGVALRAALDL